MNGFIGFYRGRSPVSYVIKRFSWGPYSHVAYIGADESCIEAWWKGGVSERASYNEAHSPGTVIELYKIRDMTSEQEQELVSVLRSYVGSGYDYTGLFGFPFRRAIHSRQRMFCSELIMTAMCAVGFEPLKRVEPYQVSPSALNRSPLFVSWGEIVTGDDCQTIEQEPLFVG